MKKLLLLLSCSTSILATAQNTIDITTSQYEQLKQTHQVDNTKQYNFTDLVFNKKQWKSTQKSVSKSPSSICSCLVPLDPTFTLALPHVDDGSSSLITLPFIFNFYGVNYTSLYINNNGNVSFVTPYGTYSSTPFPTASYIMIAPFWADVDTRPAASGLVYYKVTPTSIIVKWDSVGYYSMNTDKLNTFQLILTNGTDSILPAGNNVAFCYGDMQWTTGAASGGVGGFGGTSTGASPATVGVNKGDGVSYFQVGRFDTASVAFDGPYGADDGIDWLDNQGMYFNTSILGNIPPIIINNNICDTIDVYTGDTTHSPIYNFANFTLGASTPEPVQTITTTFTSSDPGALTVSPTINLATYKQFDCTFSVVALAPGIHSVTINATDNGTPSQSTSKTIYIRSHYDASAPPPATTGIKEYNPQSISIYPNPADGNIIVNHNFNASSNPVLNIVNVIGQNVMTTQLNNQSQSVDITNLNKGIYFATIISKDGKSKTIKIVRK